MCTVLCKLVGTLKVLASSTCSKYSTVFNLTTLPLKTVECLFSYYRYLKLRPSVCQPTCKALYLHIEPTMTAPTSPSMCFKPSFCMVLRAFLSLLLCLALLMASGERSAPGAKGSSFGMSPISWSSSSEPVSPLLLGGDSRGRGHNDAWYSHRQQGQIQTPSPFF